MKKLVGLFTRLCEAYLPDAFVFCLILTLVVFSLGVVLTPHSTLDLIGFWGKDFWSLNTFAMQMIFVLISGHMLATTPLARFVLLKITSSTHKESHALVLLSVFSTLACWLNWGFGLIISGILAVELAKKLRKVNFGLFIATAYSGFLVWHGGLSGSIPLKVAGNDEILSKVYPELRLALPDTILTWWNLAIVIMLLIVLPLLALWMRSEEKTEIKYEKPIEESEGTQRNFREKAENLPLFNYVFFIFFLLVIGRPGPFDINKVNWIFLSLSLLLHRTPRRFLLALQKSIPHTSGLVIQFPFYAGIMGLMQYSGLADLISQLFVQISTQSTLPIFTFISGGIVNFFVPSGGGQWVVQGPIMLKAAKELGADPARISMALAWGDAWTNMIQPFWALPILALAGLQLRDIMGYCLMFTLVSGVIIMSMLYWL